MLGSSVSTCVQVIQALEFQRLHPERLESGRLFRSTDQGRDAQFRRLWGLQEFSKD